MEEGKLLTVQKAAKEIGVSHMTIRRWIEHGVLHPIRPGREYLILVDELEKFRDPKSRPQPGRPPKVVEYRQKPERVLRAVAERQAQYDA